MKTRIFSGMLLVLLIGLSACNSTVDPLTSLESENSISVSHESSAEEESSAPDHSSQPDVQDATSQSEFVGTMIQPIKIGDGLYDIGNALFPDEDTRFSGRILDDNRLLVTTLTESVIYNYRTSEILHQLPLHVERLGMEHFYSQQQISENKYTVILYDRNFNLLAQHESDRPAIPAIDGKTILYSQNDQRKRIITLNTETGEEKEFEYKMLKPNEGKPYDGGIWVRAFDGEYVFFSTTCNPLSGNDGIGALSIMTGEGIFSAEFPETVSGIPEPFGENKAIFWQDGSAYETDGSYFILMDRANQSFVKMDVGTTACRISDNSEFLVAVRSEWKADTFQIVLTNISTYHCDSLELISSKDWGIKAPIESDYGGSFSGISISDDGRYICFSGSVEEADSKRQTLFMYEVQKDTEVAQKTNEPDKTLEQAGEAIGNPIPQDFQGEDFFIYQKLVCINASDIEWINELNLTEGEFLGEIKRTQIAANYANWDATTLPVGTKIYQHADKYDVLIAVEGDTKVAYMKMIEG